MLSKLSWSASLSVQTSQGVWAEVWPVRVCPRAVDSAVVVETGLRVEAARHHLHLLPHLGLGLVGDHVPAHLAIALGSGEEGGLARQGLAQVQGEEGFLAIRLGVGEVVVTTHIWGRLGRGSVSMSMNVLNLLTAAVPWNPF